MNESERDQRLDAAWRAASREEPPPALDAAIRTAARQAVGAGPEHRRDKHWWYPLAAAATVAALAVGIAQLTPPEQVAPTIVTESGPSGARQDGGRQSAAAEKPFAAPAATPGAALPGPVQPAPAAPGSVAADALKSALAKVVPAKPGLEPSAGRERARSRLGERAFPAPEAAVSANTAPPAVAAATRAAPRREPFPAAPAADERGSAYAEERTPLASPPAGAVGALPLQQSPTAAAKVSRADVAPLGAPAARSVEEWIKRIRDLKTEGRLEEAAKELAAFRAAYGERADALLPADLQPHPR